MAKQWTIEYDGTKYTLEYTRRTVQMMERRGFVASDVEKKPMTVLPELFAGAFLAHHQYLKKNQIEEIYAHLPHRNELIGVLAEMYNEPLETLLEEPEESEGNAHWTKGW